MNNNQTEVTNNTTTNNNNNLNCKNNKKNLGLVNYTYADYVILSSTLAYAIGEELNDEDLALFIIFLSQVSSDLALIRTKRAILGARAGANETEEEEILEAIENEGIIQDVSIVGLDRSKRKKVKKKKIKKKKA